MPIGPNPKSPPYRTSGRPGQSRVGSQCRSRDPVSLPAATRCVLALIPRRPRLRPRPPGGHPRRMSETRNPRRTKRTGRPARRSEPRPPAPPVTFEHGQHAFSCAGSRTGRRRANARGKCAPDRNGPPRSLSGRHRARAFRRVCPPPRMCPPRLLGLPAPARVRPRRDGNPPHHPYRRVCVVPAAVAPTDVSRNHGRSCAATAGPQRDIPASSREHTLPSRPPPTYSARHLAGKDAYKPQCTTYSFSSTQTGRFTRP